MQPPEVIEVTQSRICCDGGGGALGHPRVWYTLTNEKRQIDCGYCGRRFVLKQAATADAH